MPQITQIKPQKKSSRVNVYLDGKFAFGVDLDSFVKLGLKAGIELSDNEVKRIVKKAEFQKTLDKLLRYVSLRPRSEKEIRDYLERKKVYGTMHKELFNRLKRSGLVDDEQFAKWWIDQRVQFRSKSKRDIVGELRNKGIESGLIAKLLQESDFNEVKFAKKLLFKNAYKWKKFDQQTGRQKKAQYLARKGFSWESIKKVVLIDQEG